MNKKLAIILSVILVFIASSVLVIALTTRKNKDVLVVNEVTHSIFYAPFYVAISEDFFEEENIKIDLRNGGGSDVSMGAILSGEADIALVGPETTIYTALGETNDQPKIFAQLTKRDGQILIAKTPQPNFKWEDTIGKTIIGGRAGGMPAMTLQYIIEQMAGLEIGTGPNQVDLNTDVAFNLISSVFSSTDAEYCTLFEPVASSLIAEGKGHRVASIGAESGEIPYTAFVAKQSFMQRNPEKIKGFIRALVKGYRFIIEEDIDKVVDSLHKEHFATTDKPTIKASLETYIGIDAWVDTPVMRTAAFDKLQEVLINAGMLEGKIDFDRVVENSYAHLVMAEFA